MTTLDARMPDVADAPWPVVPLRRGMGRLAVGTMAALLAVDKVDLEDRTRCLLHLLATCRELEQEDIFDGVSLAIFRARDLRASMDCAG